MLQPFRELLRELLKPPDRPVLRQQHGHRDALERDRTGGVGAPRQLQPRRPEQIIQRLLVFPPQSPPKL